MAEHRSREERRDFWWTVIAVLVPVVGVFGLLLYAFAVWCDPGQSGCPFWKTFGVGLLVAGACFLVGALAGFVFAIPRSVQADVPPETAAGGVARVSYQPNTNLEQISDWLTKILVGVGLTQLGEISTGFSSLAKDIGPALGPGPAGPVAAGAMVLYFLVAGFLLAYLATRLVLTPVLPVYEQNLVRAGTVIAEELSKVPLDHLDAVEDLAAWARAQKRLGNYAQALEGLKKALAKAPDDQTLLAEYNAVLPLAGGSELRVLEGAMFNSLYEETPEAVDRVIQLGKEYIKQDPNNPRIYVYLAAAYGQKHHRATTQEEKAAARQGALENIRRALALDPGTWYTLNHVWDPDRPGKQEYENDLEDFYDDPEFRTLLGSPPTPVQPTEATPAAVQPAPAPPAADAGGGAAPAADEHRADEPPPAPRGE